MFFDLGYFRSTEVSVGQQYEIYIQDIDMSLDRYAIDCIHIYVFYFNI